MIFPQEINNMMKYNVKKPKIEMKYRVGGGNGGVDSLVKSINEIGMEGMEHGKGMSKRHKKHARY
jgi:hypothetical protein